MQPTISTNRPPLGLARAHVAASAGRLAPPADGQRRHDDSPGDPADVSLACSAHAGGSLGPGVGVAVLRDQVGVPAERPVLHAHIRSALYGAAGRHVGPIRCTPHEACRACRRPATCDAQHAACTHASRGIRNSALVVQDSRAAPRATVGGTRLLARPRPIPPGVNQTAAGPAPLSYVRTKYWAVLVALAVAAGAPLKQSHESPERPAQSAAGTLLCACLCARVRARARRLSRRGVHRTAHARILNAEESECILCRVGLHVVWDSAPGCSRSCACSRTSHPAVAQLPSVL